MLDIGFIQGRLCELVDGKIQAFPWKDWRSEFSIANKLGIKIMEWTLDQERFEENPFINSVGQHEVLELMKKYEISIPSLTGDCFMQAPFYKSSSENEELYLLDCLSKIIDSCSFFGTEYIVFPLVDHGRIENEYQRDRLFKGLMSRLDLLRDKKVKIIFESDFAAESLGRFISDFPEDCFGINYDSGNSAALGYNVKEEFEVYSNRILNIHIKDRVLNGGTVPLGQGDCDFISLFACIKEVSYEGNLILQTARALSGNHVQKIQEYVEFVKAGVSGDN